MMASGRPSVLFVSLMPPAPGEVDEAEEELDLLRALLDAVGVRSERWFLLHRSTGDAAGERVVDDLRTWWPARLTSALRVEAVAGRLRGLRLRAWARGLRPDGVVLDDGVGGRLLGAVPGTPTLALRPTVPAGRVPAAERSSCPPVDVVLVGETGGSSLESIAANGASDIEAAVRIDLRRAVLLSRRSVPADAATVRRARERHALPPDVQLVSGWGDDGWLDGPDLLVRSLWVLEHHHGIVAHGAWFGLSDAVEIERCRDEARRCGVADRFHLRPAVGDDAMICGDAVFLPYRSARRGTDNDVAVASLSGAAVVAFPSCEPIDEDAVVVPPLDVDAAASALADGLRHDRWDRADRFRADIDAARAALIGSLTGPSRPGSIAQQGREPVHGRS